MAESVLLQGVTFVNVNVDPSTYLARAQQFTNTINSMLASNDPLTRWTAEQYLSKPNKVVKIYDPTDSTLTVGLGFDQVQNLHPYANYNSGPGLSVMTEIGLVIDPSMGGAYSQLASTFDSVTGELR